jgi:putative endopeptidase
MNLPRLCLLTLLIQLGGHCVAAAPASGLDAASFDPATRVQDDLFRAANGKWLDNATIPANKSYVLGVEINDITDARIRAIVDELARKPRAAGIEQQVGAYYASFRDTAAIDRAGLTPLKPLLAQVDALDSVNALAAWQGSVQGIIETPVWLRVFPDLKDPTVNRVMTWQGGLGLPDRDYYLKPDDARLAAALLAYRSYLATLARLAGMPHPEHAAERVIALERRIAATHWPRADTADPARLYNPMTPAALAAQAPGFDWQAFLGGAALPKLASITVTQPSAASATAALYTAAPLADWKLYFKLRLIDACAPVLPAAFRQARFAFRGTALGGATTPEPRWQQAIGALNGALGEAVGQLYVARHFSSAHKARVQTMVAQVLAAYRESIMELAWMTPATKAQALDKLARYGSKIGYPDTWRDYSALTVVRGDALGNRTRAARFNWALQAAKADHAVDRAEWQFTAQTVDAMYDPMLNEIVFPAASLQPPFFDINADDAANYGAIGANIGHEISHGFDAMGSQFDGQGVMRNWWTDADRKAFDALGQQLVKQFDAYEALPGKHVNGKLTLSENIADLSGLQVAFRAYRRSLNGQSSPVIDGLSGEQRFFLAAAQFRRVKMRDAAMLTMLSSDPHAPHAMRANGPAINTDGFHQAFGTAPGDAMYRPAQDRIRIW